MDGGVATIEKLTDVLSTKVRKNPILELPFRYMPAEHSQHVAHLMAEGLMGPKLYTEKYEKEALQHRVGKHNGKHITEQQRKQWVHLLMVSADEIGLPDAPEF